MANQKNSQPILLPKKQRVLLPPQHHCLSSRNYQFTKTPQTEEGVNSRKRRKQTSTSAITTIDMTLAEPFDSNTIHSDASSEMIDE